MFHVLPFQNYYSRVFKSSVFFIAFFLLFLSWSDAASISNYGQWKNLNSVLKTVYTAGVLDTMTKPLGLSDYHDDTFRKFDSCLTNLQITVVEVTRMVDNFYLNLENRGASPQEAIRFQLVNGHCYQFLK